MSLPHQNPTSKGCASAHPQAHLSPAVAELFRTSSSERDAFIKQSGLSVQLSSHQNSSPYPPCYTQLTIVTCCCLFRQCIVCDEKEPLSLPSPSTCQSKNVFSRKLHRDPVHPSLHPALGPRVEIVFPSPSSGHRLRVDTGACKPHCCTGSQLAKRIFLAARQKLARFGFRQRRSVRFQSKSPTCSEHRGQSSTERFLTQHSASRIELQRCLLPKADSGMIVELPAGEIKHASRELRAELPSKGFSVYELDEPFSISESNISPIAPLPHFAPSRTSGVYRLMSQESVSPLGTSSFDVRSPRSANESQDLSNEIISEDPRGLRYGGDDVDHHIRSISDNMEQKLASGAAVGGHGFITRKMSTLAGRAEFCESPTSISSEVELEKVGYSATTGEFAGSSAFARRQASYTSSGCTLVSPVDSDLHRQSCHGISKLQASHLQLFGPSNQHCVPSESSSCDRSASICDCLYLQRLNLLRGPPSSELLATLNSQSGKLEGSMPSKLLEHIEAEFEVTTDQFLRKLNELKELDFRAVVEPVHKIRPNLGTGLSALESLRLGQVPNRLNGVISILSIAYSIVTMLIDEQSQAQFTEALFLDAIEWKNAIECREEADTFEWLLQYVWLPAVLSSVCIQGHRWPSCVWRSFCPSRAPFEQKSTLFEEGRLTSETKSGFKLRTGLTAEICQWYVNCECRLRPSMNAALTWTQISIGQTPFIAVVSHIRLPVAR